MIVANALGPVFLLVLLGALLRRLEMPGNAFWPLAERITYYIFFPSLLVHTLGNGRLSLPVLADVLAVALLIMLVLTAFLWAVSDRLAPTAAAFTSVYQGSVRFNTYVGLAAATGLWGATGLAATAVVVACMVPLVNLCCIAVFALKVGGASSLARQVALNPLILACVCGIVLSVSGIGLPGWTDTLAEILGRPALPLGLLAVGAGLTYQGFKASVRPVLSSALVKLLATPVLALGMCRLMGLTSPYFEAVILVAALPTATSAYILSRQLGGDAPLMATVITVQTFVATFTLPLVLFFLTD